VRRTTAGGGIGRREFLRQGAAAGLGLSLAPLAGAFAAAPAEPPRVRRTVTLGRTGLEMPDIGFGSSRLDGDEALVRHALERGITWFDTAESYQGGSAEETLGRALQGQRDRVRIVSKHEAEVGGSRESMMRALEGSLARLRTDRIDVFLNHAVNDLERLRNPEWFEFAARAREQGKILFSGFSGHGGNLVECIDHAVEHGLADVMLVAHNFGQDPAFYQSLVRNLDFVAIQEGLPQALARARGKGIGVIAMKTLRGARLNDMRPYETGGATFAQAAFRWVLASGHVDALVVTMNTPEMVDEYLGASGWQQPTARDLRLLDGYDRRNAATQCRYGCRACADACPQGVPISDVLRTRMYDRDYGDPELARGSYAALGAGAEACLTCADQGCRGACPFGVEIEKLTAPTHRRLAPPPPPTHRRLAPLPPT
jgi:predicted aldo/keto reductase-like oxidoreductase